jgi:hypothetical protein
MGFRERDMIKKSRINLLNGVDNIICVLGLTNILIDIMILPNIRNFT